MDQEWTEYQPAGKYVPIEDWGRDHWSTLLYVETRNVDHRGLINNLNMRTDARLHREFAHDHDGGKYPTRLKGGELDNHDDWSCLEDMAAAGLLRAWFRVKPGQPVGGGEARISLTTKGHEIASRLRRHKAQGGNYVNFELDPQ